MKLLNKVLLFLAYIFKLLRIPHIFKYALFLLIRKKSINVYSKIEISDVKVSLNLGNFIEYWIFMDGLYEADWIKKVGNLVHGKVLIDVGANIGVYPLSLFKEAKLIYAFEPEKENYKRLVQNLKFADVKNTIPINKAVSSSNQKQVSLYINKEDSGWHSLSVKYPGRIQKVQTITLDNFIRLNKIKNIGLIKIDVEGAEFEVVRGAIKTLLKLHPPVLVEFNKLWSGRAGQELNEIYAVFKNNNYIAYILKNNSLLKRLSRRGLDLLYNENVLFLPKGFHPK